MGNRFGKLKHGGTLGGIKTSEYSAWSSMKCRCFNTTHQQYSEYGGRGITVCDRWKNSFANFLVDMGKKPFESFSLDRIDVDGIYEPTNCRWASKSTQVINRRKFTVLSKYTDAQIRAEYERRNLGANEHVSAYNTLREELQPVKGI